MGNTLAITNSANGQVGQFKQNNQLTKFIQTALTTDENKKRVCCLQGNNNLITMALPYVNSTNPNIINSGVIMFDVFSNPNYLTDGSCTINKITYPSTDGLNNLSNDGYVYYQPPNTCYSFYTAFCNKALSEENTNLFDTGSSPIEDPQNPGAVIANDFADCNCQNSTLGGRIQTATGSTLSAPDIVYTLDATCAGGASSSNFKTMPTPNVNLCLNLADFQNVKATAGSLITLNQVMTCNNENTPSNAQPLTSNTTFNPSNPSSSANPVNPFNPSSSATPSSSANQTGQVSKTKSKTELIIIIITIVIILLSVGGFLILKIK